MANLASATLRFYGKTELIEKLRTAIESAPLDEFKVRPYCNVILAMNGKTLEQLALTEKDYRGSIYDIECSEAMGLNETLLTLNCEEAWGNIFAFRDEIKEFLGEDYQEGNIACSYECEETGNLVFWSTEDTPRWYMSSCDVYDKNDEYVEEERFDTDDDLLDFFNEHFDRPNGESFKTIDDIKEFTEHYTSEINEDACFSIDAYTRIEF